VTTAGTPHGTRSRYVNAGCRCSECRAAATVYQKARRAARAPYAAALAPHGTANGYNNWRCRCTRCRAAWNAYIREYKRRRKQAAP
jgi:hypothetical protein